MCSTGSGRFCERSTGKASVYGNILLPGMVYDGKKTVSGLCKLYLHGTDADDLDSQTDQTAK